MSLSQTLGFGKSLDIRKEVTNHWHQILLALGFAMIISAVVSSYWQYSLSRDVLALLQTQEEGIKRLDSLLIDMLDAEAGVLGYLVTKNRAYMEPYRQAMPRISDDLGYLRSTLNGNPEAQKRLAELNEKIELKLGILANSIKTGRAPEGATSDTTGPGKASMDEIRRILAQMKSEAILIEAGSMANSKGYLQLNLWITFALGFGSLLLLIFLAATVQRKMQVNDRIEVMLKEENERLETLVRLRTFELNDMATYLSNIRETEKNRLARELHDEMGAILTTVKMDTGWITHKLDENSRHLVHDRLERITHQLNRAQSVKRRIIDDLRPPLLEELGLVESLQAMFEDINASNEVRIMFKAPIEELNLSPDKALALFRITQEALTNARKYAAADTIQLELERDDREIRLKIQDNGNGFDMNEIDTRRTHGIKGMKFRIQMFSGRFNIFSAPQQGTRIEVAIPA